MFLVSVTYDVFFLVKGKAIILPIGQERPSLYLFISSLLYIVVSSKRA
jgi:hypothetical protein